MIVAAAIRDWGLIMQPRQIARSTSFEPYALKTVFTAFDDAWSEVAPKLSANPVVVEAARTSLAAIIWGLASTQPITVAGLRTMAVAMFCAQYRIELDDAA
jgi:hypothetical protein